MSNAFRSLLFSLSGRFDLAPREDASEYAFSWEGMTVRLLPDPKDGEFILVDAEIGDPQLRGLLQNPAVLSALHRLNGEAVGVRDWRFALDETDAPILRANFRAADFEGPTALDGIVADAARFADVVLVLAEMEASTKKDVDAEDPKKFNFLRA